MLRCCKSLVRLSRLPGPIVSGRLYKPQAFWFSNSGPIKNNNDQNPNQQSNNGPEPQKQKVPEDEIGRLLEQNEQENKRDSSSTVYILAGGSIVLMMSYMLMQVNILRGQNKQNKFKQRRVEAIGKADIGGEWRLHDTKGNPIGSDDLKGCYYLIYFGFCNCPDICPNSLIKLAKACQRVRKTPQGRLIKLKSVFVSVDPDRDSNQKIENFLSHFDPNMIGVTGTHNNDPALKDIMKKFKIYATKMEYQQEGLQGYTVDHTIITYLIDDKNEYLVHLGANLSEHDMAKVIVDKIQENQKAKLNLYKR